MIVNGNFSEPNVSPSSYRFYTNDDILGWNCLDKCEIQKCTILIFSTDYCTFQSLDLNTDGSTRTNIIQNLQLKD